MSDPIQVTEKIKITYLVKMSNGIDIKIDPDELDGVMQSLNDGQFKKVRQGILNPSFVVAITKDEERYLEVLNEIKDINAHNSMQSHLGRKEKVKFEGMIPLRDIFEGVNILPAGVERPQLNKGKGVDL